MEKTPFSVKLVGFLSTFSGVTAYSVILGILLACGMGLPIPEDITLLAAGFLAGIGNISLTGAFIAGFVGVMAGDSFLFFLGRKLGYRAFKLPIIRLIMTEERISLAKEKVISNSKFICFTARFLPGLRSPIFLTSGILGVPPLVFFGLDGFAALISVPVWILLGWWFGDALEENPDAIEEAIEVAKQFNVYIFAGLAVLIVAYVVIKRSKKKKFMSATPGKSNLKN